MVRARLIQRLVMRPAALVVAAAVFAVTPPAVPTNFASSAVQSRSSIETAPPPPHVDRSELMRVVRTLSGPAFEGRRTGSPGGIAARRFIREAFKEIGVLPLGKDFIQPFTFVPSGERGHPLPRQLNQTTADDAANVIGFVPGTRDGARTIVVSAHYDHLGKPGAVLYPGADDNASGIAVLLAVARYLHTQAPAHRVVLAAFDAEEYGLEGAKAFMKMPAVPAASIALNINFDMVSRNNRNEIYVAGTYHTPSLKPIVEQVQRRTPVKILFGHDRPDTRGGGPDDWTPQSDHGVFHDAGIPFLYFGVEDHADYHRPTDTADKINPTFFGNVADMLVDVVITADRDLP